MQSYPADYGSGFYAGAVDMSRSFNITQIKFMQEIGLNLDFSADLSDASYIEIEEKVACYLQISGFDSDYEPTEKGRIAESILDVIASV